MCLVIYVRGASRFILVSCLRFEFQRGATLYTYSRLLASHSVALRVRVVCVSLRRYPRSHTNDFLGLVVAGSDRATSRKQEHRQNGRLRFRYFQLGASGCKYVAYKKTCASCRCENILLSYKPHRTSILPRTPRVKSISRPVDKLPNRRIAIRNPPTQKNPEYIDGDNALTTEQKRRHTLYLTKKSSVSSERVGAESLVGEI